MRHDKNTVHVRVNSPYANQDIYKVITSRMVIFNNDMTLLASVFYVSYVNDENHMFVYY